MSQNPSNTGDASKKILKSSLAEAYDAAVEGVYENVEGEAVDDTVLEEPTVLIRSYTGALKGESFPEEVQSNATYVTQLASFKLNQKQITSMRASIKAKTIENAIDAKISSVLREKIDSSPSHKEMFDDRRNEIAEFLIEQQTANSIMYSEVKNFSDLCLQINRFGIFDTKGAELLQSIQNSDTILPIFGNGEEDALNPYSVLLYNLNPWRWIKISDAIQSQDFIIAAQIEEGIAALESGTLGLVETPATNIVNKLWRAYDGLVEFLSQRPLGARTVHLSHTLAADNQKYQNQSITATMAQHLRDAKFYLNYGVPNGLVINDNQVQALAELGAPGVSPFVRIEDHTTGFDNGGLNVKPVSYLGLKKNLKFYSGFMPVLQHKSFHNAKYIGLVTSQTPEGAGTMQPEGFIDPNTGEFVPQFSPPAGDPPQPDPIPVELSFQDHAINLSYEQLNLVEHPGARASIWLTNVTNSTHTDGTYSPFNKLAVLSSLLAYEATVSNKYDEKIAEFNAGDVSQETQGLGDVLVNHNFSDIQSLTAANSLNFQNDRFTDLFKYKPAGNDIYLYDKSIATRSDVAGTDIFSVYIKPAIEATTRSERNEKIKNLDLVYEFQKNKINKMVSAYAKLSDVEIRAASGPLTQRQKWFKSISPMPVFSAVTSIFERLVTWHIQHTEDDNTSDIDTVSGLPTDANSMITQMACLALTGTGSSSAGKKKQFRNSIVRTLCYRDVLRATQDLGFNPSSARTVAYTSPMLSRIKATLELTEERYWEADDAINNSYKALHNLIKDKTFNKNSGAQNDLFEDDLNVSDYRLDAFPEGSYVASKGLLLIQTLGLLNGAKNPYAGSADFYDFILDAVDKVDKEVFGKAAQTSDIVRNDYTDNEAIIGNENYFRPSAGVTKANRIDRSILISLVVDVVADFLASVYHPRIAIQKGDDLTLPASYTDDSAMRKVFVELITVDKAKNSEFPINRNRQAVDVVDAANKRNPNGIEFIDTPGEVKKFTSRLNFRKPLALIGACRYVTHNEVENTRCLSVLTEQNFTEWYMRNYISLFVKNESVRSDVSLVKGFAADAFKRSFVQGAEIAILGVNGSSIANHIKNAIMAAADSDKSAMKSIMEIYAIHAEHHRQVRRVSKFIDHTDNQYETRGIQTPAETITTPMQAIKRQHLLADYKDLVYHDPGICVPSLNFSFNRLIEMFLHDVEYNPEKRPGFFTTEGRTIIKYGVSPGSFYDVVTDVLDGETNLNKVWDRNKIYVPANARLSFERRVAVEPAIKFDPIGVDPKLHLNLMVNERHLKKILDDLGNEPVGYRSIVESVKFICPTQVSVLSTAYSALDSMGHTWAELQNVEGLGGLSAEKLYESLEREIDCFCIRKFFQEIFSLETDENVLMHGDQSELSKNFLEGLYQSGELFPLNPELSIEDIVERLSVDAPAKTITMMTGENVIVNSRKRKKHNQIEEDTKPRLEIDQFGKPVVKKPRISKEEVAFSDILFSSILSKEKFSFLGRPVFDKTVIVPLDEFTFLDSGETPNKFLDPSQSNVMKNSLSLLPNSMVRFYKPFVSITLET